MDETIVDSGADAAGVPTGSDRPIFIVACPRSGTTLLQVMLSAHRRIALPPENRFFLDVYRDRAAFGDLRDSSRRAALAQHITAQPTFRDLKIPAATMIETITSGPPTLGSALGLVFQQYAALYGKPRWGDKRPLYLNHLPTVLRLFPDAQVIHVVRDGRDCVASLKRMPWWESGSVSAIGRWLQSMEMGRRARKALRPDQYHELRYEDLVTAPEAELKRLCGFLEEEFDEAMLVPARIAPDAVPDWKTWHVRTHGTVDTAAVRQWTTQLEPWEVGVIQSLGRRHLRRHGYPLSPDRPRPSSRQVAATAADLVKREAVVYGERIADRRRSRSYRQPVAALLTAGQVAAARATGDWAAAHGVAPQPGAGGAR